jgi:hypothetical protein
MSTTRRSVNIQFAYEKHFLSTLRRMSVRSVSSLCGLLPGNGHR